jgi:hypothetical protein
MYLRVREKKRKNLLKLLKKALTNHSKRYIISISNEPIVVERKTYMMTKREFFETVRTMTGVTPEMREFIDHQVELLDNAKLKDRKPTKVQKENVSIKETIVSALNETPVTISDLIAGCEELSGFSNQKISALLSQLVKTGEVVKTYEKRKAYFARG